MSCERKEIGELSLKHEGVTAEWTIKNILSYTAVQESFYSPTFDVPGSQWRLCVYPNGQKQDCVGWVSLYLRRVTDSTYPKSAVYSLGVKKVDGTIEKLADDTYVFPPTELGYGTPKFLKRSELEERKSELLPSNSLTVSCTLRVEDSLEATTALMKLSEDFKDMFICKRCSDATLKVKDRDLLVHKAVLESRSPVLQSMFEIDMKEKKTGVAEILDCEPDVFEDFLTYLYSGKFENNSKRDLDMYRIADKYAVEDLRLECVRSMLSNLKIDNLFDVAHLAHQFNEEKLKNKTQEFFNENLHEITSGSTKWIAFLTENVVLANALLKNMADWMKEKKTSVTREN